MGTRLPETTSSSAVAASGQRRRAVVASTVGTSIEWYDFFLYGTAAALVFPQLFFPGDSAFVGVLASFATQFVGFACRPIGAAIFGHFGDRIGRKTTLITTLLLMGVGTFLIGCLPGLFDARRGGAGAAGRSADRAGYRRRRRMGRLGAAVHGVGQPPAARPDDQLAATRGADRPAALHRRGQADRVACRAAGSTRGVGGFRS